MHYWIAVETRITLSSLETGGGGGVASADKNLQTVLSQFRPSLGPVVNMYLPIFLMLIFLKLRWLK